jgi:hypothetical protein
MALVNSGTPERKLWLCGRISPEGSFSAPDKEKNSVRLPVLLVVVSFANWICCFERR